MYKIPSKTLFTGKNLVYVPQCHSTNSLAADLGQKVETPEGTVVITDHQVAGRGQRGNSWESEPGKNLTLSVILRPAFLAAKDQFQLNEAVSVGIVHYLATRIMPVAIKWPNDIMVGDRKVCGILIENHINGDAIGCSIVGIGMNINQRSFSSSQAESVGSLSGKEYDLAHELEALLEAIELWYLELKNGNKLGLENHYLHYLYRKGEIHSFIANNKSFEGVITGVNEDGKIRIQVGGEERVFGAKEISFSS